jgi:ABC-type antimicrobial peptide transport system permease subunit
MTLRALIFRSLRFHARSHLGVLVGTGVASAVLTGALLVGDSMRQSLRERALGKLGWVHFALAPQDRLFSRKLLWQFSGRQFDPGGLALLTNAASADPPPHHVPEHVAVALMLPGTISREDGSARANKINVLGVDDDFLQAEQRRLEIPSNSVVVNRALAQQLHVREGEEILLRCRKPASVSREIAVTPHNEETGALRLKVHAVTDSETMGDFTLRTGPVPALNAFVRLDELSRNLEMKDKANLLVAGRFPWLDAPESVKTLNDSLRKVHSIDALGFELRIVPGEQALELRSDQIFLEPELVRAAQTIYKDSTNHSEILTLLANVLRAGSNSTPYSMVTAAGSPFTPAGLKDDEIVLSQWLAEDLNAATGATVSLTYFDPESGAALAERTNVFRVHSIVPMEPPWADRTLMPDFPGIEKAESESDWDAGFPLTYKIRPKDEDYWKKYKGTPKAFITLAAGQKMWGNRFGNLTAIRFLIPSGVSPADYRSAVNSKLVANLNPEALGLRFEPVREQTLKGAEQSQDFGQLFLGFSIFLMIAALLLMALLFQFGLEQRTGEMGILLALGFSPKKVRLLFLLEGSTLALIGALLGAAGGALYAQVMLKGLTTIWRNAVGAIPLHFFASFQTVAAGIAASVAVAIAAIWLTLRKQGRQPARELLTGHGSEDLFGSRGKGRAWAFWVSMICALSAIGILVWAFTAGKHADAEVFFSGGCLLLIAGLTGAATWLRLLATPGSSRRKEAIAGTESSGPSLKMLAIRGCARRRKRILATIGLLATGAFLIVAVGVFRLDANQDALKPTSGTGGFALIGQSTLPVVQNLNTSEGRQAFALDSSGFKDARFVPFRVRDGDEASCLNLDRAQRPRLLGVKPELLAGRFTFEKTLRDIAPRSPWMLLSPWIYGETGVIGTIQTPSVVDSAVPAIADANSLEWALHKKVGDALDYIDEQGRSFKLRVVGAVANSVLQGSLLIDESEFMKRFPGESGYRMFLIDVPSNQVTQVSEQLSRALQDVGLELTSSVQRLNTFNAVQNTYLGTFEVLGGLGLLLGSAGLAIVVLRNMLERRGELGLLTAVGFTRKALQKMTLIEHGSLLLAGLGIGMMSALVAVLPALLTPGRSLPYVSLGVTLAAVIVNGLLWTWLSTNAALRGNLVQALRNE